MRVAIACLMRTAIACLLAAAVTACAASYAAAEPWEYRVETELTMTQSYYSDNWTGGEVGNIAWRWNLNSMAARQFHPALHTSNALRLRFGQTHNQDENDSNAWKRPQKSDDLIDFESVFRVTALKSLDPYVSLRLESQFYDASDRAYKRYVNPLRFTESAGLARVLVKGEQRNWLVRLGVASRQYVDRDVLDDDTMQRETLTEYDGGLMFDSDMRFPLAAGRIVYSGKLNVYKALFSSRSDDFEGLPEGNYWKTPDLRWENTFSANVTGHIVVNLHVDFRYDKNVDLKGRFKQALAVGVNYRFGSAAEKK